MRISPNGGDDVGMDENSVGDFTNLVFSINPNLNNTDFPSVQNGDTWGRFQGEITGLGGMTTVRVAIRYFVTDAGGLGTNSSTIGLDDLDVFSGNSTIGIEENNTFDMVVAPNPATDVINVSTEENTEMDAAVYNATGQMVYSQKVFGRTTIDISEFETGVYILELRDVNDGAIARERVVKN